MTNTSLKIKPVKIGKKLVGNDHRCYVIAEIGSNFDGSLSQAKRLIKLAKSCGADAAKFQSFITEKLISRKGFEKKIAFQSKWKKSVWDVYKEAELPRNWHAELNQYAKKIGIDFFTSPWDFEAVDLLEKLNVPAIKIGSGDITHTEILKYIASKKKPILLATGSSTMKEVDHAVDTIKSVGNNKIILMHAVVQYPSSIQDANLKVLHTLRERFNLNVGYSDHSPGSLVAIASVAMGACVIEKHFTIDSRLTGPDHPHSMNPQTFSQMVNDIRLLQVAMGDGIKIVKPGERETRVIQRRGIWTTSRIKKGELFTNRNLAALRPNLGIPASEYERIIGKKAKKTYNPFVAIKPIDI